MSKYRPHVKEERFPPIKDKDLLVGPEDHWTLKKRAEWLRKQGSEIQDQAKEEARRFNLILKATDAGLIQWSTDYTHYRDGTPYCKCESVAGFSAGSVDSHNARFEQCLKAVDDGR